MKLVLYIRGSYFDEMDIDIPEYENYSFVDRVDLREGYVKQKALEMKKMFVRAIIKGGYDYRIELVAQSRFR